MPEGKSLEDLYISSITDVSFTNIKDNTIKSDSRMRRYLMGALKRFEQEAEIFGEQIDINSVTIEQMNYSFGESRLLGGRKLFTIFYATPYGLCLPPLYAEKPSPNFDDIPGLPILSVEHHKGLVRIEELCRVHDAEAKNSKRRLIDIISEKVSDLSVADFVGLVLRLKERTYA